MKKLFFTFVLALCVPFMAGAQGADNVLEKAKAGDAAAQYSLYLKYSIGNVDNLSDAEGIQWLTKAANGGISKAQFSMAEVYKRGLHGVEQNDAQYLYWLTAAANHDTFENKQLGSGRIALDDAIHAQHILAWIYREGNCGVRKNMDEYLKWETKSAENGNPAAALSLGNYYKKKGKKQEAIYWLKKTIDFQPGVNDAVTSIEAARSLGKLGVKGY